MGPQNMVLSIDELHRRQLEAILLLSINLTGLVTNIYEMLFIQGYSFQCFLPVAKRLILSRFWLSISVEHPPCNKRLERYRIVLNIYVKKISRQWIPWYLITHITHICI